MLDSSAEYLDAYSLTRTRTCTQHFCENNRHENTGKPSSQKTYNASPVIANQTHARTHAFNVPCYFFLFVPRPPFKRGTCDICTSILYALLHSRWLDDDNNNNNKTLYINEFESGVCISANADFCRISDINVLLFFSRPHHQKIGIIALKSNARLRTSKRIVAAHRTRHDPIYLIAPILCS